MEAAPKNDAFNPVAITERFFTVVKSLSEFDKAEIPGTIETSVLVKDRDVCFKANYTRAYTNVDSILVLKRMSDFQAIAMIARALMELAIVRAERAVKALEYYKHTLVGESGGISTETLRDVRRQLDLPADDN